MSQPLRVVICDDDPDRVTSWAERLVDVLGEVGDISPVDPHGFAAAVASLRRRALTAKASKPLGGDAADIFDAADVVVLDSDLTPDPATIYTEQDRAFVHEQLSSEMGGEIAHLIRAFTTGGALMVVNEGMQQRTFDLTLTRWATGVADVYVTGDDIDNVGLWRADPPTVAGYRPWSWPRLDLLPERISAATSTLHLDAPLLATVGLDPERTTSRLLARQKESLPQNAESFTAVTFRMMAESEPYGLRLKEKTSEEQLMRVAVCAVRRWLERVILPSMNLLIDLPHLIQQRPWLMHDRSAPVGWNNPSGRWWPDAAIVERDAFNPEASSLLGRNVWTVAALPPQHPADRLQAGDLVFCEDNSMFMSPDAVRDFVTDLEGPFPRRYVVPLADAQYHPRTRLAI